MRVAGIALTAALLAAAPASAAPFGELPFQVAPGGVSCLRATGAPGELIAWAPGGARPLRATATGLVAETTLALGDTDRCPVAAVQPNGAGVVAVATPKSITVALREPGGAWSAPVVLPHSAVETDRVAAAISERGDAILAWREYADRQQRIRAVRRP